MRAAIKPLVLTLCKFVYWPTAIALSLTIAAHVGRYVLHDMRLVVESGRNVCIASEDDAVEAAIIFGSMAFLAQIMLAIYPWTSLLDLISQRRSGASADDVAINDARNQH